MPFPRSPLLAALGFAAFWITACCIPDDLIEKFTGEDLSGPAAHAAVQKASALLPASEVCAAGYAHRAWCPAASLGSATFAAPAARKDLLGLTVVLTEGGDRDAALASPRLVVLHIEPSTASLEEVRMAASGEQAAAADALASLGRVLQGQGGSVQVTERLQQRVVATGKAGAALTVDDQGGHFNGAWPSHVFQVSGQSYGSAWVVLEEAGAQLYVSLFPEVPLEVLAPPAEQAEAREAGRQAGDENETEQQPARARERERTSVRAGGGGAGGGMRKPSGERPRRGGR
jgi:hypothetical protein